jgi:hypothetical protein
MDKRLGWGIIGFLVLARFFLIVPVLADANTIISPTSSATSSASPTYVPPQIEIDTLSTNTPLFGTVNVAGWAVDDKTTPSTVASPITSITVSVDGGTPQRASFGGSRPDVCSVYSGPGCPYIGFDFGLDTTQLSNGVHTVTVTATDGDPTNNIASQSAIITVQNVAGGAYVPPNIDVDDPLSGATIPQGTVSILGWALDNETLPLTAETPISFMTISVDGGAPQPVTYGSPRTDVCTIFPNRPDCPNVGFSYNLDTSNLSVGPHTIKLTATDGDPGSINTNSTSFIIFVSSNGSSSASMANTTTTALTQACNRAVQQTAQDINNEIAADKMSLPSGLDGEWSSELGDFNSEMNNFLSLAGCPNSSGTTPIATPPSSTTTASTPVTTANNTNQVSFPATILVDVTSLNVRSAPETSAPLAGSETLASGDEFTATTEVTGESVDGNDIWYVSSLGNYVWSGGTEVAGESSPTSASTATTENTNTTGTVLGTLNPTGYLDALIANLQSAGYQVTYNTDAFGEIIGTASKDGQEALTFDDGDDLSVQNSAVTPGGVVGYDITTAPDSCTVNAPQTNNTNASNTTPTVPVLISPDGTIPHISQDFNVVVDPSAYSQVAWDPSMTQDQIQSDVIGSFLAGYTPYNQVAGLPQATDQPGAGAMVVIAFANIPTSQYSYLDSNGQLQTDSSLSSVAQTITLIPGTSGSGQYIPQGSSQLITDALNAGKQVAVIVYNSTFLNHQSDILNNATFSCVSEHEPGHFLGLGDDYENGNSPMRGGGLCDNGTIPIQSDIANTLTNIQTKTSLVLNSCAATAGSIPANTNSNTGIPPGNFVPLYSTTSTNPSLVQWVLSNLCTSDQLNDGWVNTTGGCYHPTTIATSSVTFGNFPDASTTIPAATCQNNYGVNYVCSAVSCGAQGQLACPASVPTGTCVDANGNQISCPNGIIAPPEIPAPPVPTDESSSTSSQDTLECYDGDSFYTSTTGSCDDSSVGQGDNSGSSDYGASGGGGGGGGGGGIGGGYYNGGYYDPNLGNQ